MPWPFGPSPLSAFGVPFGSCRLGLWPCAVAELLLRLLLACVTAKPKRWEGTGEIMLVKFIPLFFLRIFGDSGGIG